MNNYIYLIAIAILATFNNHILVEKEKVGEGVTIAKEVFDFGKRTIDKNSLYTTVIETPITPALIRQKNTNPIKIIFDTDMDSDVDDVGALAMLHAMMTNGEVEILAVMVSSTCPGSAACADAVNTYYGRPDIPIGVKKGNGVNRDGGYVSKVAERFPQDIGSGANAHDAKVLYRQILAESPDKSVAIVNVGYFTNLKDLLKTTGDSISNLNGRDLVNAKVTELVGTGGEYPRDLSFQGNGNFEPDGEAVKYVNKYWPTMLTFVSGEQYFWDAKTGAALLEEDMNVNPVAFAYQEFYSLVDWDRLYPDHHSADQIGVYVAVRGFENKYILTKTTGYFHIWDNGLCEWRTDSETPLRRITYSLKDPYQDSAVKLADIIETLMLQDP